MKNQHIENEANVKSCNNVRANIMIQGVYVRFYGTWQQFMGLIRENYFVRSK